jgi:hypothetical protein
LQHWQVQLGDRTISWEGYTGPQRLSEQELAQLCQDLLGIAWEQLDAIARERVRSVGGSDQPRLILHSTTPGIRAFESDLATLSAGRQPLDLTTYTETRSLYLARPGDVAVGRTFPWCDARDRSAAETLTLDDRDYYYLSHALLHRAQTHPQDPLLLRLINLLRDNPQRVVALYSLEPEMQLFLLWLSRQAGLAEIQVDANPAHLAAIWNCKAMLHPTVAVAQALPLVNTMDPESLLELESSAAPATEQLGFVLPVIPGYTLPAQATAAAFAEQLGQAADLLIQRHGLRRGCLKPSRGGDGSRIMLNLDLDDRAYLQQLAQEAWQLGGDYLLEAHVTYGMVDLGGEQVLAVPSAHVRQGAIAEGMTLQFIRGTSWKGNIYLAADTSVEFGIAPATYHQMQSTMHQLAARLQELGLVRAGVDFAVCRLGGRWGDHEVIAVQDINIKLTGAEFLRVFQERQGNAGRSVASRVFRPTFMATAHDLQQRLARLAAPAPAELIAIVPGRWGIFAATGDSPRDAAQRVLTLEQHLVADGWAWATWA